MFINRSTPHWKKCSFVTTLLAGFVFLCVLFLLISNSDPTPSQGEQLEIDQNEEHGEAEEEVEADMALRHYDPLNPTYMTIIPGFGPNNQYLGLKDVIYMSKIIGRTLGRPNFFTHAINHLDSVRTFDQTLDIEEITKYLPTVSLPQYRDVCGGVIDRIVWARPVGNWRSVVKLWMLSNNMTYKNETFSKHDLLLMDERRIAEYFQPFLKEKCIAFAFPFRNVAETEERKDAAKFLSRAPSIVEVGKKAFQEMGVTNLLAIHWRWGEDSCGWWTSPAPHTDYDFCWGTSLFHYARLDHVVESLKKIVKEKAVSTVYLAVSSMYNDKYVLRKLKELFDEAGVKLFVGKDSLDCLKEFSDNYLLSLIEQEICAKAQTFIWSSDSTWSDFIVNHNDRVKGSLETIAFSKLLERNGHPYSTWNRERDVGILNQYKRKNNN